MPKDHATPINEADRQARAAFRAYVRWFAAQGSVLCGQYPPLSISPRTLERIASGRRDVPPGLARETAALIREDMITARERSQLESWAQALDLWADDCAGRSNEHA